MTSFFFISDVWIFESFYICVAIFIENICTLPPASCVFLFCLLYANCFIVLFFQQPRCMLCVCIKAETVFSALNPLKQTALELY